MRGLGLAGGELRDLAFLAQQPIDPEPGRVGVRVAGEEADIGGRLRNWFRAMPGDRRALALDGACAESRYRQGGMGLAGGGEAGQRAQPCSAQPRPPPIEEAL